MVVDLPRPVRAEEAEGLSASYLEVDAGARPSISPYLLVKRADRDSRSHP